MNGRLAYYVSWLNGYRYERPGSRELRRLRRKWKCAVDVTDHLPSRTKPRQNERYGLWRSERNLYQSEVDATAAINRLERSKTYSVFSVPLADNGWPA